jgi:hypothetical protein
VYAECDIMCVHSKLEAAMTSDAQLIANRRNSSLSTGPRSAEGKARSRRNALRHGLAARTLVVAPWEDEAEFAEFAADLRADLAPDGAVEEALAQRVVLCAWRLERICRIEADLLAGEGAAIAAAVGTGIAPVGAWPEEMAALARYEGTLDRALERSMKMLRERQKLRRADDLPEAPADVPAEVMRDLTERSQFAPPAPAASAPAPAERSQFGETPGDGAPAERSQFDETPGDDRAERSQFGADDEEELLSPQDVIARREAERLERARLINESCRPKGLRAS